MKLIILTIIPIIIFANIKIDVSSNSYGAIKEISKKFTLKTGIKVDINSSGSGVLYLQIKNGAKSDIFFSADSNYPIKLYKLKKSYKKPYTYAYGNLIFISNGYIKNLKKAIEESSKIVIAKESLAPYGIASIEVLKKLKLYIPNVKKIIKAQNITLATILIMHSQNSGFTSKSMLNSKLFKSRKVNYIEIPKKLYNPIKQDMIMLNNRNETKEFFRFMKSIHAKKVLQKYGYGI